MAKIETVKQEVTFTLELNESELGTIVSALRNPHSQNQENAQIVGITKTLSSSAEADLYFKLRDEVRGVN